jgi:dCMP deaminase
MDIAFKVSTRATCTRKSVGCVLVRDNMLLSSGYNGSIRGMPHCEDDGCMMENDHCIGTIHAEANALVQAARNGVAIEGAEAYVTASPCWTCFKMLVNAGVKKISYSEFYRDDRIFAVAEKLGIEMVHIADIED